MPSVDDLLNSKGREVVSVPRTATVFDAAKLMRQHRIGAVVVYDGEKIIGIFTERDLMYRVVAEGRNPTGTHVHDVMTSPIACAAPATGLDECRTVMTRNRIRHLPIVEEGRLVGMISSGDILAREIDVQQATIQYLHEYMHGRT